MWRVAVCLVFLVILDLETVPAQDPCSKYDALHDPLHRQTDLLPLDSVITPLWDTAWTVRNLEALFAVGPAMAKCLPALDEPRYSSHNTKKFNAFKTCCVSLRKLIAGYLMAAGKRDSGSIDTLLPHIKAVLDTAKAGLLPVPYPAFDRLHCRVERLTDESLDERDSTSLVAVTDSIVTLLADLQAGAVPQELSARSTLMQQEVVYFNTLGERMMEAALKGDRRGYNLNAIDLKVRLNNFLMFYLQ